MTVADVAKVAGVSTALVHYHFSSKVDLITAAVRVACDDDKELRNSVADGPGCGRAPARPRALRQPAVRPERRLVAAVDRDLGRDAPAAVAAGGDGRAHGSRDRGDPPAVRGGRRRRRVRLHRPGVRRRRGCRHSGTVSPSSRRCSAPASPRCVRRRVPRWDLPRARAVALRVRPTRSRSARPPPWSRPDPACRCRSPFALSAGAIWSFGTVLARVADGSDVFQYLIWRSLGIIAVVELWALCTGRPQSTLRAFTSGSPDARRQRGVAAGVDRFRLRGQDDVAGERRLPRVDDPAVRRRRRPGVPRRADPRGARTSRSRSRSSGW